jgi:hypothetical protein
MRLIPERIRPLRAISLAMLMTGTASSAIACDDFIGNLLSTRLTPAVQSLGCSALGKAGVDVAEHRLESVCYTSSGPTSKLEIVVGLRCRTSDRALIPVSISGRVTADAGVRGSDCTLLDVHVRPSGEIGKILIKAFNAKGQARKALEGGLRMICGGRK